MNHVVGDPATGTIYGGGGNEWFGPAVWKSEDLGESWTHSSEGLAYEAGQEPIKSVWSLSSANGSIYAGVQPAGLFRTDDGGQTWSHVEGLQKHPTRPHWNPGGAGPILHSIVRHPEDHDNLWIGISAAGVFHTADGGQTWSRATRARGPTTIPTTSATPNSASACTTSPWPPACPTASTSRTIAECTAPTTAASGGKASRRACP